MEEVSLEKRTYGADEVASLLGVSRAYAYKVIRRLILIVASISFVCALVYVINRFVIAPASNDSAISELRGKACQTDSENNKGTKKREQDWDVLEKENNEIVGWLRIDDTPIDYPVLYRKSDNKDHQYYLDHNYKEDQMIVL